MGKVIWLTEWQKGPRFEFEDLPPFEPTKEQLKFVAQYVVTQETVEDDECL